MPLNVNVELDDMADRFKRIAALIGEHLDRRPFDNTRAEAGASRLLVQRVYNLLPEAARASRDYRVR